MRRDVLLDLIPTNRGLLGICRSMAVDFSDCEIVKFRILKGGSRGEAKSQ